MLKPQIYEALSMLGDKMEKVIVSNRIVYSLCDVGVRLVSECGAHCESAGTPRQFHELVDDVLEDRGGESNALDHDRVDGGFGGQV